MPPVLVVCEEAHRYIPAGFPQGFAAATRAISRIAKEGRKYGVALGLVTQRPSELAPGALTQCGTLFALRMSNEQDHRFVANALPEGTRALVDSLPALRRQEAVVMGEGVAVPMRIRFDDLPPEHRPCSTSARFSQLWRGEEAAADFLDDSIRRWRQQIRAP